MVGPNSRFRIGFRHGRDDRLRGLFGRQFPTAHPCPFGQRLQRVPQRGKRGRGFGGIGSDEGRCGIPGGIPAAGNLSEQEFFIAGAVSRFVDLGGDDTDGHPSLANERREVRGVKTPGDQDRLFEPALARRPDHAVEDDAVTFERGLIKVPGRLELFRPGPFVQDRPLRRDAELHDLPVEERRDALKLSFRSGGLQGLDRLRSRGEIGQLPE